MFHTLKAAFWVAGFGFHFWLWDWLALGKKQRFGGGQFTAVPHSRRTGGSTHDQGGRGCYEETTTE